MSGDRIYVTATWHQIGGDPAAGRISATVESSNIGVPGVIADDALNALYTGPETSPVDSTTGLATLDLKYLDDPNVAYRIRLGDVEGVLWPHMWSPGDRVPLESIRDTPGGQVVLGEVTVDQIRQEIDGKIARAVAAEIAGDPAVIDAAVAKVSALAAADIGLAHATTTGDAEGVAWGVVDPSRRALPVIMTEGSLSGEVIGASVPALSARLWPASTDVAAAWGLIDATGRALPIWCPDGTLHPGVAAIVKAQIVDPPALPTLATLHVGTSLTATPAPPQSYPDYLSAMTGWPALNKGWAGSSSATVATYWGAIPVPLAAGVTIPASGGVTVAVPWETVGSGDTRRAVLAGVPGVLTRAGSVYTFTRDTAGTAVVAPAASPLLVTGMLETANDLPTDRVLVVECSRNDPPGMSPGVTIARLRALIARLARVARPRVVVLGEPMATTDSAADKAARQARNAAVAAAFPGEYVPAFEWLLTEECRAYLGLTWTIQDLADIAAGVAPAQIRADTLHPNPLGAQALARRIYLSMSERGWI